MTEPAGSETGKKFPRLPHFTGTRTKGALCVFFLVSVIIFVFGNTVFLGKPISHAYLLANRDVMFREYSKPALSDFDESCYLMVIPSYFQVANYLRSGELPLWNPYSGWGQPFAGDICLGALSPLRLIFSINPCMRLFNLLLVFQVVVAVLGTYLLSRSLRVSRFSSVFAGISYAMCPFVVWFSELSTGASYQFLPLLAWVFVRLSNRLSMARALTAGVAAGIYILVGHPEVSFLGIAFCSLLLLCLSTRSLPIKGGKGRKYFLYSFFLLVIAGLAAFCTCAIVFLEFIIYALQGSSYKFSAAPSVIPWPGIVINVLQPSYGCISPFLGSLAIPLSAIALFLGKRNRYCINSLALLMVPFFILGTRPGPLAEMLQHTPINWLPGVYCTAIVLLCIVLLASMGLDIFARHADDSPVKNVFVCASLFVLTSTLILFYCGFNFGSGDFENYMRESMAFRWNAWLVNLIVLSVPFVAALAWKGKKTKWIVLTTAVIVGSFVSQILITKSSMPVTPQFEFSERDPIPFLKKLNERLAVTGYGTLSANDNCVFGIRSVSVHSPLVNGRYQQFMRVINRGEYAMRVREKVRAFNTVLRSNVLSPLMDLTGVRYVVSMQPVWVRNEASPVLKEISPLPQIIFKNKEHRLSVKSVSLNYKQKRGEVVGKINWEIPANFTGKPVCMLLVQDEKGNPLWFGESQVFDPSEEKSAVTTNVVGIVPLSFPSGGRFEVRLQLFDSVNSSMYSTAEGQQSARLATFVKGQNEPSSALSQETGPLHYEPIYESMPDHIRVYRNNKAVERAYVVREVVTVSSPDDCLFNLMDGSFDPHRQVVIETNDKSAFKDLQTLPGPVQTKDSVKLIVDSANEVHLEVSSAKPGMLVLTDTFYPGWEATIDDERAEIYRANYLFRAIRVPEGKYKIKFKYRPLSVKVGGALFLALIITILAYFFWKVKRPRKRKA